MINHRKQLHPQSFFLDDLLKKIYDFVRNFFLQSWSFGVLLKLSRISYCGGGVSKGSMVRKFT